MHFFSATVYSRGLKFLHVIYESLRVFENKVLRRIFVAKKDEITGEWRKLHNAELHALYSSPVLGVLNRDD